MTGHYFLWRCAVEAAQAGFDVSDPDAQFGRDESGGHSGIDVSDHHQQVRPMGGKFVLQPQHDRRGLRGLRAAAALEINVRLRDAQIAKEARRHIGGIMLAGMDEARGKSGPAADFL